MISKIDFQIKNLCKKNNLQGLNEGEQQLFNQLNIIKIGYNCSELREKEILKFLELYLPDLVNYFKKGIELKKMENSGG